MQGERLLWREPAYPTLYMHMLANSTRAARLGAWLSIDRSRGYRRTLDFELGAAVVWSCGMERQTADRHTADNMTQAQIRSAKESTVLGSLLCSFADNNNVMYSRPQQPSLDWSSQWTDCGNIRESENCLPRETACKHLHCRCKPCKLLGRLTGNTFWCLIVLHPPRKCWMRVQGK